MLPRCAVAGLFALCLAPPATAQEAMTARYTISVSGLTAGRMTLAANHDGTSYALSSNTVSAGLAGLFRSFRLTSRVKGAERYGRLIPQQYASQAEGARVGRGAELSFEGGVASVVKADAPDPEAPAVNPVQHKGAVDPLTGLYAVLRDTTPDNACRLDLTMFDGHRISRVTLSSAVADGDALVCQGVYHRVDGYPPKDLARRPEFPFVVTYRPVEGGGLRVTEVSLNSLYGPARMTRDN